MSEAGRAPVDEVLAFARTIEPPSDGDLRALRRVPILHGLQLVRRVIVVDIGVYQRHGDIGHAERLAVARTGKY